METSSLLAKRENGIKRTNNSTRYLVAALCVVIVICALLVLLILYFPQLFNEINDKNEAWTLEKNIILPSASFEINYFANITDLLNKKSINISTDFEIRTMKSYKYDSNITIIYLGSKTNIQLHETYLFSLIDYESDGINDDIKILMKLESIDLFHLSDGFTALELDQDDDILYVGKVDKIWKCYNISKQVLNNVDNNEYINCNILMDNLPFTTTRPTHDAHTMVLNPVTRELCVVFGITGCDHCIPDNEYYGTIRCYNVSQDSEIQINESVIHAKGVRNPVGLAFHPINNYLWFTDNGVGRINDVYGEIPDDELNVIIPDNGNHFGEPFCVTQGFRNESNNIDQYLRLNGSNGYNYIMEEYADLIDYNCSSYILPAQTLGAHVVPLGMYFYSGNMFPEKYNLSLFVAEKGSAPGSAQDNDLPLLGYRIVNIKLDPIDYVTVIDHSEFAFGWVPNPKNYEFYGRPIDVEMLNDGSLIVSDSVTNCLYRITYDRFV